MTAERTVGTNWSRTYTYRAERLLVPGSIEEAQEVVAASPRIRALGSRHSFNDIADTGGDLITLAGIDPDIRIDPDAQIVSVTGGTPYAVLAARLHSAGFALHNLGSLPHITVAGAISTGTHGSGIGNRNQAGPVVALDLIRHDGELVRIERGDPDFSGAVVTLGALGVVATVHLAIRPTFQVAQDRYTGVAWDTLLDDPRAFLGAAYSVSVFTKWEPDELDLVWCKWRTDGPDFNPPEPPLGGAREIGDRGIGGFPFEDNLTVRHGIPGPWHERLPHFRADAAPSVGDEIQSEYFVPLDRATDALRAMRQLHDQLAPVLATSELRTVAADDLWLSPAFQQDSLAIHFTWLNRPTRVLKLLPVIESVLEPFRARPHWGKVFALGPEELGSRYPRMPGFRALVARFDPGRKFWNDYLARVLDPRAS